MSVTPGMWPNILEKGWDHKESGHQIPKTMSQTKASQLALEIAPPLEDQEEVVLDTNDIQRFLSEPGAVDSVEAMKIIRQLCEKQN